MLDIFEKYIIKLMGKNLIYAINNQICIFVLASHIILLKEIMKIIKYSIMYLYMYYIITAKANY